MVVLLIAFTSTATSVPFQIKHSEGPIWVKWGQILGFSASHASELTGEPPYIAPTTHWYTVFARSLDSAPWLTCNCMTAESQWIHCLESCVRVLQAIVIPTWHRCPCKYRCRACSLDPVAQSPRSCLFHVSMHRCSCHVYCCCGASVWTEHPRHRQFYLTVSCLFIVFLLT